MAKSLPLIVPGIEQLQLIYLTDLDHKEAFDTINKINDDFKRLLLGIIQYFSETSVYVFIK